MTEEIKEATVETTLPQVDNAIQGLPGEFIADDDMPLVWVEPTHVQFTWPKHGIIAHVSHFNNQRCHAELELWFYNAQTGHKRLLIPTTRVDLMSASGKQAMVRQLKDADSVLYYLNWDWMLNCIAFKIIDVSRRQEPIREVVSDPNSTLEPDYLLKPLLYRGHPVIIFGAKGSSKSLLALVISYVVQLPLAENKLGLTTSADKSPCTVLYLDYEDEESSFTKRWSAIQKGFRLSDADDLEVPILYKRMTTKLADSVEPLRAEIADRHIGLVIVDSLGPAARGKLNDPEPAIEYHAALRALGVTSLTLAHNSKDPLTKTKSIFGSVFFANLGRLIWECKAEKEPAGNELIISLKQTDANLSGKHIVLGYKYTFDTLENKISIEQADLRDTSLSGELTLPVQIRNLLRNGAKTLDEITTDLESDRNTIKTVVYRLANKGTLVKIAKAEGDKEGSDKWGVAQQ